MTQPLSRYSTADLARLIAAHPDAPPMSAQHDLAHPRPRRAQALAAPALALPARPAVRRARPGACSTCTPGGGRAQPLAPDDCVLSADEQTSIQARVRCHATTPPRPGQAMRVEHEYARGGALAYLAAWDVRRGGVIGRCEPTTGIAPFGRLVDQVMAQEPYRSRPARLLGRRQRQQPSRRRPPPARSRRATRT